MEHPKRERINPEAGMAFANAMYDNLAASPKKSLADRHVSVKMSEDLYERCSSAARVASISRSAYIKLALLEKLERDNR